MVRWGKVDVVSKGVHSRCTHGDVGYIFKVPLEGRHERKRFTTGEGDKVDKEINNQTILSYLV